MSPIDLSRLMQPFAANLVHDRAVLVGQVQFRLAHDDTSVHPGLTDRHQLVIYLMQILMPPGKETCMRTTINIDDELLAKVAKLTGPLDRSAMVREGLKALIERESAKRLARLGGSQPGLKAAPRRRQEIKKS